MHTRNTHSTHVHCLFSVFNISQKRFLQLSRSSLAPFSPRPREEGGRKKHREEKREEEGRETSKGEPERRRLMSGEEIKAKARSSERAFRCAASSMRRSLSYSRRARRETACAFLSPSSGSAFLSSVVFLLSSSSFLLCGSVGPSPHNLASSAPSWTAAFIPCGSLKVSSLLSCERGSLCFALQTSSRLPSPFQRCPLFSAGSRGWRVPFRSPAAPLSVSSPFWWTAAVPFSSSPPFSFPSSFSLPSCLSSCSSCRFLGSSPALPPPSLLLSVRRKPSCSLPPHLFCGSPSLSSFLSLSSVSASLLAASLPRFSSSSVPAPPLSVAPSLPLCSSLAAAARRSLSTFEASVSLEQRRGRRAGRASEEREEAGRQGAASSTSPQREKRQRKMEVDGESPETLDEAQSLVLEEEEERLFDMLVRCVEDLKLNVVLRAAGGWVRDKLMNRRSDDIDIAIDKCTGVEFATNLNKWLRAQGLPTHAIGVVASNPDQSKHLETATCRLAHHQVDFVHLRTETYSEHSRIPENIGFGTPAEDAHRRDFTLNALFYNLHTKKVENFTKTGLEDLRRRVLRTPLENARETLLDDPLRVLRGVRLAALLRLQLHEEVVTGAQTKAVREGLKKKVSRERLGIELKKMLSNGTEDGAKEGLERTQETSGDPGSETGNSPSSKKRRREGTTREEEPEGDGKTHEQGCEEDEGDRQERGPEDLEARAVREKKLREVQKIANVTDAATQGFLLLAELRVVDSIFSLPDQVLTANDGDGCSVESLGGKGETAGKANGGERPGNKKTKQNGKQLGKDVILSDQDTALQGWWKDGLRCMHTLNSLLSVGAGSPRFSEVSEITRDLLHMPGRETEAKPEKPQSNGEAKAEGDGGTKEAARASDWQDAVRALSLAAFLFPLATRECLNEKKKPENLLFHMVVTGVKLAKKDGTRALDLNKGAHAFLRFLDKAKETEWSLSMLPDLGEDSHEERKKAERVRLGLLLREAGGDIWPQALLLAAAIDQTRKTAATPSVSSSANGYEQTEDEEREVVEALHRAKLPVDSDALKPFADLRKQIDAFGLADAHLQPPLCDGHRVKTLLKNLPKGPLFKEILDEQIKWQLAHPAGTAAACEEYLRTKYSTYV
ncbi:tRNA nucleotidyltransferase/poly(A) polymerase family protein [Toxoplasma gondii GT1]|uniref:tRNA nucleotidyltransferase/poly(A) polymerase family protein n=2 Tax=Toxoplasma gondii TaxID=5811 RepID=S7VUV9_TOXGG|nr:tRNA nucleotidyltransferase/poly(A) polymerase family protein [Toxoplasma gondii GT1]